LELTPDRHVLVISYSTLLMSATPNSIRSTQIFSQPIPIDFDFRKGRRYELHYRTLDNRFTFDIVDVTDGGSRRTSLATWGRY